MKDTHTHVTLALGANIHSPYTNIQHALEALKKSTQVYNLEVANIYRTSPVGDIPQPDFFNTCCRLETPLTCQKFQVLCQQIEKSIGKGLKEKMGPRPIDIDLLFFGEETHTDPQLTIPHPRWKERLFVLIPLRDLYQSIGSYDLDQLIKQAKETYTDKVVPHSESARSRACT